MKYIKTKYKNNTIYTKNCHSKSDLNLETTDQINGILTIKKESKIVLKWMQIFKSIHYFEANHKN